MAKYEELVRKKFRPQRQWPVYSFTISLLSTENIVERRSEKNDEKDDLCLY
jgi:hypothetical protein